MWELTVGMGGGMGGGGQRRKNWDNCNRITILKSLKKEKLASQDRDSHPFVSLIPQGRARDTMGF